MAKCAWCDKPIQGKGVTFMKQKFHKRCLATYKNRAKKLLNR